MFFILSSSFSLLMFSRMLSTLMGKQNGVSCIGRSGPLLGFNCYHPAITESMVSTDVPVVADCITCQNIITITGCNYRVSSIVVCSSKYLTPLLITVCIQLQYPAIGLSTKAANIAIVAFCTSRYKV
jgi:hypothetical protein